MSYQVLARKWRPRSFAEMAGQEHVLRALINALDQGRLHQAYLFTGTRGVGKTTIARILAKALNCETGVSATPCGQCASCREIDEGRFIDLIEVDAASRTKVEDTRELLDNVQYTPTRGRYKVYLIDEVHMLSNHSFNALLKTLEEPPPHVKFLLATTDPQKLPATVLSRCLQFNLKRMPLDLIEGQLAKILDSEKLEYEPASLKYLAHAADGSMRDALSLLDQAIAYGQGAVKTADVMAMLGYISREPVFEIVDALIDQNAKGLLQAVGKLEELAADHAVVLDELLGLLQQMALAQWVPEAVDAGFDDPVRIQGYATRLSAEDIQLYYQIALLGKRDLALSPTPRRGLEMVLLRMLAFRPADAAPATGGTGTSKAVRTPPSRPAVQTAPANTGAPPVEDVAPAAPPSGAARFNGKPPARWKEVFDALNLKGMVAELASNCEIKQWREHAVTLLLSEQHAQLYSPNFEQRLAGILSDYLGRKVSLKIEVGEPPKETPAREMARQADERQQAAVKSIEEDQIVRALKEKFDAEVQPDSIRPLDS
jgi:DNA polymerase-3 subunit gamma/tau